MLRLSHLLSISVMILYFLGLNPGKSIAQNTTEPSYHIVDSTLNIYRSDDRLVNGKYYKPKHDFAAGHPYFLTDNWEQGKLFIKGIEYDNVLIKYNIVEDIVILSTISINRVAKNIIIHNSFLDSLAIGNFFFHNTNIFPVEKSIGIAEIIYSGKISAYYKYKNEFKEDYTIKNPFGRYLSPTKKLYLYDGSDFELIRSKKALLVYFQNHENELRQFLRQHKIRIKKASPQQIESILQFCEQL